MATFSVTLEIGDPQGQRYETVEALVDSGSSLSVAPASLLQRLGVAAVGREPFRLAHKRRVRMDIGETRVRVDGRGVMTLVVFGPEDQFILGAYTLEGLRLAVDPIARRLVPVDWLLMQLGARWAPSR